MGLIFQISVEKGIDLLFVSQAAQGYDAGDDPFVEQRVKCFQLFEMLSIPTPQMGSGSGVPAGRGNGHELVARRHGFQGKCQGLFNQIPLVRGDHAGQ